MKKEKLIRNLKIFSILFIILAVCDLIVLGTSFLTEELSVAKIADQAGVSESLALGVIITLSAIYGILALMKLIMGAKGLQQAKGKYAGKIHITLAKIILALEILVLIMYVPEIIKNEFTNVLGLLSAIVNVLIYSTFIGYSKNLKEL